jgi:hypothetical protein
MEAFGGILESLGGLQGITKGVGALTSVMGMVNQFSQAQKEKAVMDRSIYYSKHPEAVSNMVAAATKPLSSGLTSSVSNVVNANLAEQGLSQAPNIQAQVLSQALAPYQQNEQQMALEQVLKTIGLPAEALKSIQSTMRPDQLALMLKQILPGSQSGSWSGGSVGGLADNALSSPSYMPQPPEGVYGPDLAPPFDPTQSLPGSPGLTFASFGGS